MYLYKRLKVPPGGTVGEFPVHVQTVKHVVPEKADDVVGELMGPGLIAGQLFEGVCPLASSSHSQQHFQLGVHSPSSREFAERTLLKVITHQTFIVICGCEVDFRSFSNWLVRVFGA